MPKLELIHGKNRNVPKNKKERMAANSDGLGKQLIDASRKKRNKARPTDFQIQIILLGLLTGDERGMEDAGRFFDIDKKTCEDRIKAADPEFLAAAAKKLVSEGHIKENAVRAKFRKLLD